MAAKNLDGMVRNSVLGSTTLKSAVVKSALVGLFATIALSGTGCSNGDTSGGGDIDLSGAYSADGKAGTMALNVSSSQINVSQTSSFVVEVRDSEGQAVRDIQVICDTENGLALIDPTSGVGLTDSFGNMSGIVGCASAGSLQIGCRLPIGANKQLFKTVKCTGSAPEGFTGFPDAGGGSLFGGISTPDSGEPGGIGLSGFSINGISLITAAGTNPFTVDAEQLVCEAEDDELVCEVFSEDRVRFSFTNDGNQTVRIRSYNYTVPNADGNGTSYTSPTIGLSGSVAGDGGTAEVDGSFTNVIGNDSNCTANKSLLGANSSLGGLNLGSRNVTFRVTVDNAASDSATFTFTTNITFRDENNCE